MPNSSSTAFQAFAFLFLSSYPLSDLGYIDKGIFLNLYKMFILLNITSICGTDFGILIQFSLGDSLQSDLKKVWFLVFLWIWVILVRLKRKCFLFNLTSTLVISPKIVRLFSVRLRMSIHVPGNTCNVIQKPARIS